MGLVVEDNKTKKCTKCGEVKDILEFSRSGKTADGYRHLCKVCIKNSETLVPAFRICMQCGEEKPSDSYTKNGRGISYICRSCLNYNRKVKLRNEIPCSNTTKICCVCHEEKDVINFNRQYNKYSSMCKDCHKVYAKAHYEANKEKALKKCKEWKENNKEARLADVRNRKAVKRSAVGKHTGKDIKNMLEKQAGRCKYCGELLGDNYHIDHVFPLLGRRSGNPNGHNGAYNLQILCPKCNGSKNYKDPIIHESSLGLLTHTRYMELLALRSFMFGSEIPNGKYDCVVII